MMNVVETVEWNPSVKTVEITCAYCGRVASHPQNIPFCISQSALTKHSSVCSKNPLVQRINELMVENTSLTEQIAELTKAARRRNKR